MSFRRVRPEATIGAEAEVPPTGCSIAKGRRKGREFVISKDRVARQSLNKGTRVARNWIRTESVLLIDNNLLERALCRNIRICAAYLIIIPPVGSAEFNLISGDSSDLVQRGGEIIGESGAREEFGERFIDHNLRGEALRRSDGEDILATTYDTDHEVEKIEISMKNQNRRPDRGCRFD